MKYISRHNQVTEGFIYNTDHSVKIINPTQEQLTQYGWEVYQEPQPQKTYEQRVVELIREKYTLDAELAIQRQRNEKVEDFQEYYEYCEECKRRAKEECPPDPER